MSHYEQFYVHPQEVFKEHFVLRGQEKIHAVQVCRIKIGDRLTAVDGQGRRYQGTIYRIDKDALEVQIEFQDIGFGEPRLQLTLAAAILKGTHFDEVVEKGVEIGVSVFQPLLTQRTLVVPSDQKQQRWQEKARAAMKQCGRSVCPSIRTPQRLPEFIASLGSSPCFIAHDDDRLAPQTIDGSAAELDAVSVLVGPEGGFSEQEIELCLQHKVHPLLLGKRRLRSETAALVAVALLMDRARELS